MATKLHATDNSVYFYDTETYDFGSQLLFHQDQKFVNTFSITFFYLSSFNNRTTNDSHEERLLLIIIGSLFLLRNLYYNYPVSQFERGEINRNKLSVERTDSAPISIQGNSKSKGIERSAPSLRICWNLYRLTYSQAALSKSPAQVLQHFRSACGSFLLSFRKRVLFHRAADALYRRTYVRRCILSFNHRINRSN